MNSIFKTLFSIGVCALVLTASTAQLAFADAPLESDRPYQEHLVMLTKRMAHFHDALKITPEQEGNWTAYQNTIRQKLEDGHQEMLHDNTAQPLTSAPQHFQQLVAIKTQQLEDIRRIASAFDALYNSLTPPQRQIADAHFSRMQARMLEQRKEHAPQ